MTRKEQFPPLTSKKITHNLKKKKAFHKSVNFQQDNFLTITALKHQKKGKKKEHKLENKLIILLN